MYKDLKQNFCQNITKGDIAEFVSRRQVCQQVKAGHQQPGGLLQLLEILGWKWKNISMDFVVGLSKSNKIHDKIW